MFLGLEGILEKIGNNFLVRHVYPPKMQIEKDVKIKVICQHVKIQKNQLAIHAFYNLIYYWSILDTNTKNIVLVSDVQHSDPVFLWIIFH